MAGTYDFIIEQGADFYREITYKDASGNPYDVTDYKGKMQLRLEDNSTDVITELNDDNGRMRFGGTDGKIYLSIPASDTKDLNFDIAAYDLFVFPQVDKVVKVLQGTSTLSKAVTK